MQERIAHARARRISAWERCVRLAEAREERARNGKPLVFVYYAGHGAQDNDTYCITGDGTTMEIEKALRGLSAEQNTYYFGMLDCCRDNIKLETMRKLRELTRGGSEYHTLD